MPSYIITYKTIDDTEREQEIFAETREEAITRFWTFNGQHEDLLDYPMALTNSEGEVICEGDAFEFSNTPDEVQQIYDAWLDNLERGSGRYRRDDSDAGESIIC